MLSRFFFLIFIIVIFTLGSLARQPRGLRLSASAGLKDVADSQISPDGKQIVFTISQVSSDHFRTVSRLCPAPMQSREVRRSNQNKANKSLPHRSPDGKLNAFYFDRDKHARHRVISHDGEELRLAAHICQTNIYLAHTGESFTCSPNSKRLAFLSSPKLLADVIR
ncbi:MAG TPA: hypothetical protein VEF04_22610, partial [Blastocatellia bacterium]|nr:hypothetical protein [Blastocatellia bacterium]